MSVCLSVAEKLHPTLSVQVSMELYTAREKEELNHVISIMIDYNLTYVQQRTLEGNYVYTLDP
jgi:chromosome transmission fidelity protein 18